MPKPSRKMLQLKCQPELPEEQAFLCDVKEKLKESGIGDIIIGSFIKIADAESYTIDKLNKTQQDPRVVSDVSNLFKSFEHDFVSMLLKEIDVDIPVCSSSDDKECLTIKAKMPREETAEYWTAYIVYIDEEGNYIVVYS